MDIKNPDDAKLVVEGLLGAALTLSPSDEINTAIFDRFDNAPESRRILLLLDIMTDGLRHSNWPTATSEESA